MDSENCSHPGTSVMLTFDDDDEREVCCLVCGAKGRVVFQATNDAPVTVDDLTRPIIGIENRTAQEAFDIMADRIRHRLAALASAPAGIGEEAARAYFERGFMACYAWQYVDKAAQLSDAVIDHAWDNREEGGELPSLASAPAGDADRYEAGYSQGTIDAGQQHQWMQDKAWQDAVLMLVHYSTLAERTWLVGHEEAARKLAEWWGHARSLAHTKSADGIAAIARPRAAVGEQPQYQGCNRPPDGWWCCSEPGHDGPCPTRRIGER